MTLNINSGGQFKDHSFLLLTKQIQDLPYLVGWPLYEVLRSYMSNESEFQRSISQKFTSNLITLEMKFWGQLDAGQPWPDVAQIG